MLTVVRRATAPSLEKPTDFVRREASRLSWAWDGLCFGVPLHESSNEGMRDKVNETPMASAVQYTWERDARGNSVLRFDTALDAYVMWPDSPRHDLPATALTAYVRVRADLAASGNLDGALFARPQNLNSPWATWTIQASKTSLAKLYAAVIIGSTWYETADTVTLPAGNQFASVFLRWRSGGVIALDVVGERGEMLGSAVSTTTPTGTLAYVNGWGVRLNCNERTGANYNGSYSQAMIWNRYLSNVELSSLVADPFGWYAPRRETLAVSSPYPLFGGTSFLREVPSG